MSEDQTSYEYLIKKQAMLNVDGLSERIAELESANTSLKEQNDNLAALASSVSKVFLSQDVVRFTTFIDAHLLESGLEIELSDSGLDGDGVVFTIPNARIVEGSITRNKKAFTVVGTVTMDWTVEVEAADEDDATEIAEQFMGDASFSSYLSHEPDGVTSHEVDDYSVQVEVSDTYES